MPLIIKIIGIVAIVMGTISLLKPEMLKKYLHYWKKRNNLYVGGVIKAVVSLFFLLGASRCSVPWFITLLGIVGFLAGISVFVLGLDKVKSWLEWFEKKPIKPLSIYMIVMGILIIVAS